MKIILALRGVSNSGKTLTLRILHGILLRNRYDIIISNFLRYKDFIAIFKKNGIPIGITSAGDDYKTVLRNLKKLKNDGCEIIITACRSYDRVPPGTNAAIMEITGYTHQFIEKTVVDNPAAEEAANRADAQQIFYEIEKLLNS